MRHLPAEGQRPRVVSSCETIAVPGGRMGGAGANGCGGGAPRPHGPRNPVGSTPARSACSRPPGRSARAGAWAELWAATRREGSSARSLTPAERASKLLQPLIAMGGSPRASRRRARAIWTLLYARALSGGARALRSSVAAPDDARSTRRAAGGRPVPLGRASVARGASACTHSSSDPTAPARDQRSFTVVWFVQQLQLHQA